MLNERLKERIRAKMIESYGVLEKHYGRVFEKPQCVVDVKSKRVAGKACFRDNKIRINPDYLN